MEEIEKIRFYTYKEDNKIKIPKGATHVELEIDYTDCYYEGDSPGYFLVFFNTTCIIN